MISTLINSSQVVEQLGTTWKNKQKTYSQFLISTKKKTLEEYQKS